MNKKINLLYLIQSFNMGGAEHLALILSKHLRGEQINPMVCALESEGPLIDELTKSDIPSFCLGKKPGKDFRIIYKLRNLIRTEQVDIIHTHNEGPLLYAYPATRFSNKPLFVHTEHVRLEQERGFSRGVYYCNKLMLQSVDLFLSIADHISDYVVDRFDLRKDKVLTIPNCVDLGRFDGCKPQSNNGFLSSIRKNGVPILGSVAALREQKDHKTLLEALLKVVEHYPEVKLLLVGTGHLENILRQKVNDLNLDSNVIFLGHRSDIPEILKSIDIFVSSSLYEGLPLCILEAMAACRPVVATNVYGNNEIVKHGVTGLLVPPKDPNQMSAAILDLLTDPQRMAKIGETAYNLVQQEYDLAKMVEAYRKIYIDMIQRIK